MLMDLRPPAQRRRLTARQSRLLRIMLAGSLLIHLLALLAVWWLQPEPPPDDRNDSSAEVAMVFESPGAKEASTAAPAATQASAAPAGNVNATTTQPNPDTSAPQPPPAPTPPTPAPPEPPPPAPEPPPAPAPPPTPEPPQPEPPQPEPPPQPQPAPPTPRTPPTVSLSQEDGPALPPPPRFVMPQPPPPLPPLPPAPPRPVRPALPRQYARPSPSNPFAAPQDWSLNTVPSPRQPGRPSRGLDLSTGDFAGQKDATLGYVAGAHPTGDWIGALRRWTTARLYYPEQAIADRQQGTSVLLLTIARSGRVTGVQLLQSARSPFLDGAWMDIFRGATVPGFTPDMTEDSTQITYTLHYRLVMH